LWSQRLEARTDLHSLERVAPALADALRNCRERLDEEFEEPGTAPFDGVAEDESTLR
jgi:hypothetical protein